MRWTHVYALLATVGVSVAEAAEPVQAANVVSQDRYLLLGDGTYFFTPERHERARKKAAAEFRRKVSSRKIAEVVLLVGTPGAGKTTYVKRLAGRKPHTLFFDATLTTTKRRAPLIRAAQRVGKPIRIVWMDTPLALALSRNGRRPKGRRVPNGNVRAYYAEIHASPPRTAEGVRAVRVVGRKQTQPQPRPKR